jgi:PLP dependent protein
MSTRGLDRVRERISEAAKAAGRDAADVRLVAVTKGFDWEVIEPVVRDGGLTDIGENRVQELRAKQQQANAYDLTWHMIGTLQRNKVADVVGRVALIHSVDSVELARAIGARAHAQGITQAVLLEVNTSGEASKHGVAPPEAAGAAAVIEATEGVELRGLMTIAAAGDPQLARGSFSMLRRLRDQIVRQIPGATELSMGMSDDLEIAIQEGATLVRIGTAIFGHRPSRYDAARTAR